MIQKFLISRDLRGPYKFLIDSSKNHLEKIYNLNLEYYKFQNINFNYKCIIFILKNIINLKFFSKKKIMEIKYKNFNISRYAVPEIYKNYYSYLNPFVFYFECIKNFYYSALTLEKAFNSKNIKIKGAFIDHGMYRNGILIEYYSKLNIPIYTMGYPKGLFAIKSINKRKLKYEDLINLRKSRLNSINFNKGKNAINKVISKTEIIPWMKGIKFKKKKIDKLNFVTHLIYTHAFTDAQMVYGYDGFRNVLEWLDFTINQLLIDKNNKIIIKAHPTFFHKKFPTHNAIIDQKLFNKLNEKYINNKRIIIIKYPIKNNDLLKRLNKKTILISHHGSAILEGLHLGFKCIASTKTFWDKKFKVTNDWSNINQYKLQLKKNWSELNFCNKRDLYDICYQLFCDNYSLYGKKYWQQIVSEELKISRRFLYENSADIFYKIKIKDKVMNKIINKISKTIILANIN